MPAGAEAPSGRPQGTRHGVDPGNRRCHAPLMTSNPTAWYQLRYRQGLAMNLRLPEDLAAGLRALAVDTGRSQQDLAREALAAFVRQRLDTRLSPWLREHGQPPPGPFLAIPPEDRIPVPGELDSVALVRQQRGAR